MIPRLPLLACLLAVLASSAAAQTAAYLPAGPPTSYAGPSVPAPHAAQVYRLFLPTDPTPPTGWPVLVDLDLAAFTRSDPLDVIAPIDGLLHDALEAGVAVVTATCTVSRGGATGNPETYPGNGLFVPPEAGVPPGYSGVVAPYLDALRPMPQKDVVMLVQHLRWNAASLGIDPDRLVAHGTSAAAIVWMWCVLGPDRGDLWPNAQGQETMPTRVAGALLGGGVTWWPALAPTKPPATFDAWHWPVATAGDYDTPADELAQVDGAWLDAASPLVFGLAPGVAPLNAALPLYLYYGADNDGTGYETQPWTGGTETDPHSVWSGFAWELVMPGTELVLVNPAIANGIEDAVVPAGMTEAVACHRLDWLLDVTGVPHVDPWSDLGGALAGGGPAPTLEGCGTLAPGSPISVTVRGGPSFGQVYLVAGFGTVSVPFYGGTLVPAPDVIRLFPLDVEGRLVLGTAFPALPSGATLAWQGWCPDASGPAGFTATQGLLSVVP